MSMEKIIIALDLNEQTEAVAALGIRLARKLGASVVLLTVVDRSLEFMISTEFTFDNQWEARLHIAQTTLDKIKEQYSDVSIEVVTFIGIPKEDIIRESMEKQAAFIVIGTHGRSAFVQFVMGGTAEYVVRHSTVPVVVLPYTQTTH
jgi:nucleotide-binding universal stress UspA family protein